MVVSPNIPPFKQVAGFWVGGSGCRDEGNATCWDWAADANQVAYKICMLVGVQGVHVGGVVVGVFMLGCGG